MICIPQAPEFVADGDDEQVVVTEEIVADEEPSVAVQEQRSDQVLNMYSTVAELRADGDFDEAQAEVVQEQSVVQVPNRALYIPTAAELDSDGVADEKSGATGSYIPTRTSAKAGGTRQPL